MKVTKIEEKDTQCSRIIDHCWLYGSITAKEAIEQYGIMRLASRIYDLKNRGYSFEVSSEKGLNRYEEKVSYAKYTLRSTGVIKNMMWAHEGNDWYRYGEDEFLGMRFGNIWCYNGETGMNIFHATVDLTDFVPSQLWLEQYVKNQYKVEESDEDEMD